MCGWRLTGERPCLSELLLDKRGIFTVILQKKLFVAFEQCHGDFSLDARYYRKKTRRRGALERGLLI
jgi:hypothetical protein